MMARAFIGISLLGIGLIGATVAIAGGAGDREGNFVVPGSKAAGLSSCVRETDFMRRNHMELILHQRHVTVHEGIRDTKYSLHGCVDCHVSYDDQERPVPVYQEGQFCRSCHSLAAVNLTCFGCHATVPAETDAEAGNEVPVKVEAAGSAAPAGIPGAQAAADTEASPVLGESSRRKGD